MRSNELLAARRRLAARLGRVAVSDATEPMSTKSEELLVDANEFETRIALLRNGEPLEIHLQRATSDPEDHAGGLAGNIYLGKVARLVPAIQAAFVDIGIGTPGALFAAPGASLRGLREHDAVLVQIAKEPVKGRAGRHGKGPKLTADPSLVGRYLVVFPAPTQGIAIGASGSVAPDGPKANSSEPRIAVSRRIDDAAERGRLTAVVAELGKALRLDWNCIVRTAAAGATAAELEEDFRYLQRLWTKIRECQLATPRAPALLGQELPTALRAVRDLAGPSLKAIVVNDDAACARIRAHAAAHMPAFRDRVIRYEGTAPLFDAYSVEAAIERTLDPCVPLASGGQLVIEHTEAMTTIDVNSGTQLDSVTRAATALGTNLEAAAVIPHQLRLRNIGGIVIVDFIGMACDDHRNNVHATLVAGARDDPARFDTTGFSELGLVEISRRRVRDSLLSQISGNCRACTGRGYTKSAQSVCYDLFRSLHRQAAVDGDRVAGYVVHAAEDVIDRLLDQDAGHLRTVSDRIGRPVQLQVEPGYRTDQFDLIGLPRHSTGNPG